MNPLLPPNAVNNPVRTYAMPGQVLEVKTYKNNNVTGNINTTEFIKEVNPVFVVADNDQIIRVNGSAWFTGTVGSGFCVLGLQRRLVRSSQDWVELFTTYNSIVDDDSAGSTPMHFIDRPGGGVWEYRFQYRGENNMAIALNSFFMKFERVFMPTSLETVNYVGPFTYAL